MSYLLRQDTKNTCKNEKKRKKVHSFRRDMTNSKHNQGKTVNNQHISKFTFHLFITVKDTSRRMFTIQYRITIDLITNMSNPLSRCTVTHVLVSIYIPQTLSIRNMLNPLSMSCVKNRPRFHSKGRN